VSKATEPERYEALIARRDESALTHRAECADGQLGSPFLSTETDHEVVWVNGKAAPASAET
jgi:hypothetical protein